MNIYTVTSHDLNPVRRLFHRHSVEVLPENQEEYRKLSVDLLVFTGGDDIYPERYGYPVPSYGVFDRKRDELEFSILSDILHRGFRPKKIFGYCRGLQLLNVGMGGTLFYDFPTDLGIGHDIEHSLKWEVSGILPEIFPEVNSIHHQGIRNIGNLEDYTVLAVEPRSKLIEAIIWSNRFLAVQFHPELMDAEYREKTQKVIEQWVNGDEIFTGINRPSKKLFNFYETSYVPEEF